MTNEEALELAVKLSCFCDEMEKCSECIFSKVESEQYMHSCGLEHKIPLEWSIKITKLPKTEKEE